MLRWVFARVVTVVMDGHQTDAEVAKVELTEVTHAGGGRRGG